MGSVFMLLGIFVYGNAGSSDYQILLFEIEKILPYLVFFEVFF